MSEFIRAPFTAEQLAHLNAWQRTGQFHPFTCGSGNRTDAKHLDGEGILVATAQGWRCPFCDYKQDFAHDFMAEPLPVAFSERKTDQARGFASERYPEHVAEAFEPPA